MKNPLIALSILIPLLTLSMETIAAGTDDVVATLGSIELKSSQIKAMIAGLDPETLKQLQTNPTAMTQLIRTEIIRQAVLKEAINKQWDKRPEVQEQATRASEQAVVVSYLNNVARPQASYPGEDETKKFYEANKDALNVPAQYRIAQIYLDGSSAQPNELEKKANELAIEANRKNSDFAQIARSNSQHKESADQGGEYGWVTEDQVIPELRGALAGMSPGEISKPIKSASGWHIVKLMEKKPAGIRPYAEIRPALISNLRLNKARQNEQQFLETIVKAQKFELNERVLGNLLK